MTQKDKLIKKFKQNPTSLRGDQVIKILLHEGFYKVQGKGSHTLYKKGDMRFSLPLHNNDFKPVYKENIKNILYPDS